MNKKYSDIFKIYLDLKREPVGIKLLESEEEYKNSEFSKYNRKIPYCTMIRNATDNQSYALNLDNFACYAAATFLGIGKPLDEFISGKRYERLKVYNNLELAKEIVDEMSILEQKNYGVEIAPLALYKKECDVIIIIANPYNIMRLTQAYAYHNGYQSRNMLLGMCALCHECTVVPYVKNEVNISLMCSGTRCVAQWKDDEMAIGIPYQLIDLIIDGLIKTSNLMDLNDKKQLIKEKMSISDNFNEDEVILNHNYFTNSYLKNED